MCAAEGCVEGCGSSSCGCILTDGSSSGATGVASAVQTAQGVRGARSHLQLHMEGVSKQRVNTGNIDIQPLTESETGNKETRRIQNGSNVQKAVMKRSHPV